MSVTHGTVLQLTDLRSFGEHCWGEFGGWVYDEWADLNDQYFGSLRPSGIIWGLTPHGRALGYYQPQFDVITLHKSLVDPHSSAPWGIPAYQLNKIFASDVLLHEMIHQKIHQTDMDATGKSSHNNGAWASEVTRIAKIMGLNAKAIEVKQRRVDGQVCWAPIDGHMTIQDISHFPQVWRLGVPHSVRPGAYYDPA